MNRTYNAIATTWTLWCEYMDADATMTRAEFDAMRVSDKVALLVAAFGHETAGESA